MPPSHTDVLGVCTAGLPHGGARAGTALVGPAGYAVLHDLGGELAVAAGVRPGYLYLGRNWLGMAFDNKLAGQVEGIFITSGRSFTSLLQRAN